MQPGEHRQNSMSVGPDDRSLSAPVAAPRGRLRAAMVTGLAVVLVASALGFVGFLAQLRGTEIRPARNADGIGLILLKSFILINCLTIKRVYSKTFIITSKIQNYERIHVLKY